MSLSQAAVKSEWCVTDDMSSASFVTKLPYVVSLILKGQKAKTGYYFLHKCKYVCSLNDLYNTRN